MKMKSLDHIVLIGLNYQHRRSSGDKNFWVDLISFLANDIQRITVLSIRDHHATTEQFIINGNQVNIRYIRPTFLETPDSITKRKRIFWRAGVYPRGWGVIEKYLSAGSLRKSLQDIFSDCPYQHVHLMDNLGFTNKVLAEKLPCTMSISAMAYQGDRISTIYDAFIRHVFLHKNLWIVPYSVAYRKKLLQLGLDERKVRYIPWGVIPQPGNVDPVTVQIPDRPTILWTGYIQQINRADFLYAIRIAKAALDRGLAARFYFAFKPESFEDKFHSFHRPEDGISVKATTVEEFSELKRTCNVLFSPLVRRNIILAPPLTWLEMLSNGVPIVTTNVSGSAEAVIHGETGFVANSDEELIKSLFAAVDRFKSMSDICRELCDRKYQLSTVAHQYLNFWKTLPKSD